MNFDLLYDCFVGGWGCWLGGDVMLGIYWWLDWGFDLVEVIFVMGGRKGGKVVELEEEDGVL